MSLRIAAALVAGLPLLAAGQDLGARIDARIAQVPGAAVGVAYRDLQTGDTLFQNADSSFHAASTMKVAVLVELFRRAEAKALGMDQPILLINRFQSIADDSWYSLDQESDSDTALYSLVGTRVALRELARRMIVRSSNLATNAIIALLDARQVTATARSLGARNIQVLRGVEDIPAYRRGMNNTTTARDLAALLAAVENGRAISAASSAAMRDMLMGEERRDLIMAGVPAGTRVASKWGSITAILHDAALVYPPGRRPYVLAILTGNIQEEAVARALIVDITRIVHAHATGAR